MPFCKGKKVINTRFYYSFLSHYNRKFKNIINVTFNSQPQKKRAAVFCDSFLWALTDSNRRPSACKADALNQLS